MLIVLIDKIQDFPRMITDFTASVDLQLHAHKQIALAVENRRGLVMIGMDESPVQLFIASVTVRHIIVIIVVCIFLEHGNREK